MTARSSALAINEVLLHDNEDCCHAHKLTCRQRHGTTVNIEEYIERLFLLPIHYVEEVTGTLLLDSSLGTPLLKAFYPNPQSLLSP